jgi:hypothetical protein
MQGPISIKTITLSREEFQLGNGGLADETLLTKEQAAVFLGVSPRTVDAFVANQRRGRRRRKAGAGFPRAVDPLPYLKIGHAIRFELGDLRRFREQRKIAA